MPPLGVELVSSQLHSGKWEEQKGHLLTHPACSLQGRCGHFSNDKTVFASSPQDPWSLIEGSPSTVGGSTAVLTVCPDPCCGILKELVYDA